MKDLVRQVVDYFHYICPIIGIKSGSQDIEIESTQPSVAGDKMSSSVANMSSPIATFGIGNLQDPPRDRDREQDVMINKAEEALKRLHVSVYKAFLANDRHLAAKVRQEQSS